MKMLNYIDNFEAAFEELAGERPDAATIRFVEQLNKVGKKFESKGKEDASEGLLVPPDESFAAWGSKVFYDDPEMAESIGDLMKYCYLDGYNAGRVFS